MMARIPVGLSISSVFPDDIPRAFELAAELGFDGVEVTVTAEPLSQNAGQLAELAARYDVPVLSIHSPCLMVTARVWGTDPMGKIERSLELADALGARTVVAHPPFVWQRKAAATFADDVAARSATTDIHIAIENMFQVKVLGSIVSGYRPHWNPVLTGYPAYTLDLSHTAASGVDGLAMAQQMGDRLKHIHLGDGSGAVRDEHLVPGTGIAACAPVLDYVAKRDWNGLVILEITTRMRTVDQRRQDLVDSLDFARTYLSQASA